MMSFRIDRPFPGEWYAGADRPSAPSAASMRREIEQDLRRIRGLPAEGDREEMCEHEITTRIDEQGRRYGGCVACTVRKA